MAILPALLEQNNALLKHAARELEHAVKGGRFLFRPDYLLDEHLFFKTYLSLREVEIRGLRLLHEVTILAQLLQKEEEARQTEQEMEKNYKAQEKGDGKQTIIISRKQLKKQEKVVTKDRKLVQESLDDTITFFLAQHEILVQTAQQFRGLAPGFKLLHPRTDRKILKIYARAEASKAGLHKHIREEVALAEPLNYADHLLVQRSKLRGHLTELSNARREFAGLLHKHFPMVGAL
ncbi:MAG TPA: hypothetical protein VFU32_01670 [Ktedonobacterales bacterium]|nr:hypothetical protein [Ktedonobacterales bacterium]